MIVEGVLLLLLFAFLARIVVARLSLAQSKTLREDMNPLIGK